MHVKFIEWRDFLMGHRNVIRHPKEDRESESLLIFIGNRIYFFFTQVTNRCYEMNAFILT